MTNQSLQVFLLTLQSKNWKSKENNTEYDLFNIINYWRTPVKIYSECCLCEANENIQLHYINSLENINYKKDQFRYIHSFLY